LVQRPERELIGKVNEKKEGRKTVSTHHPMVKNSGKEEANTNKRKDKGVLR